jgi:endonuclease YncB( thermonuclease family)
MVTAVLILAIWPAAAERIARVVDGDTVVTASGEKVRLMGYDAPEIRGECPRSGTWLSRRRRCCSDWRPWG